MTGVVKDTYPPILFSNAEYTDQGRYQCMVFIEGVGFITSTTRDVQFEGNHILIQYKTAGLYFTYTIAFYKTIYPSNNTSFDNALNILNI